MCIRVFLNKIGGIMSTLKIYKYLEAILCIFGFVFMVWLMYDYYTLRQQHIQIMLYLTQPVKTDPRGVPIQRAQALDDLIPRESNHGTGDAGK